jgi:drug/metabolite transporter (DMT)-like permease
MTGDPLVTGTPTSRSHTGVAVVALLSVTAAWGSTFFLIKDLLLRVPVPDFLAVRFAIAAVALALIAPRTVFRLSPTARRRGAALGLVYGLAQILQTEGLAHTAASISGFVTGMYVVLTPLLAAVLLRSRIQRSTWVAVLLATGGLAFLALKASPFSPDAVGYGELVTLGSALLYALHIVGVGAWTNGRDAFGLAVVQMAVIAAVCTLAALPDGIAVPERATDWLSVVYMALVAGAFALVAQTWAQAHLSPTRSAIVMCMEPVWAAFFAVLLGGESLTFRILGGGGLILAAMYITELAPKRTKVG